MFPLVVPMFSSDNIGYVKLLKQNQVDKSMQSERSNIMSYFVVI